ncbi:MAG: sodium:proton antiporter [Kiritimatiellae bacterium]|nr:sodium:proton antiporter [Kiritimatiellia bacterium]
MTILNTATILIVLAALFSYLNFRFLKFPSTIGLLVAGLLSSCCMLAIDALVPSLTLAQNLRETIGQINFTAFLMQGLLGFLLFAGALHVNLGDLLKNKWPILTLSSIGVLISTAVIGFGTALLFSFLAIDIPLAYCFVFGALISPTDPVAVLGIMKSLHVPRRLETKVSGESLLNDGFGVVAFAILLAIAGGGHHGEHVDAMTIVRVFLVEVVGGIGIGLAGGLVVYHAIKGVNEHNLEIMLSVALVLGISCTAFAVHASAPLACVVAGLMIGNHGRLYAMSDATRDAVDLFWSFTDYILNAVLFLLLGLEVLAIPFNRSAGLTIAAVIPLVLAARFICVAIPIGLMKTKRTFMPGTIKVLTWGGLRGGISVALALSLPEFEGRSAVLNATYGVVIFSIIVQGLTIGRLIRSVSAQSEAAP